MNELIQAAVLGLVEGATEFIPVSSTGHLIIVGHWLGFVGARANLFEIVIQLGAILAVVWQYRELLWHRLRAALGLASASSEDTRASRRLILGLAIAFLPAAIVGFLTHDYITAHLFSPRIVAWALVVGGVGMWAIETWRRTPTVETVAEIPLKIAFGIGVAQVASLIPGMSRSASTIMGALLLGVARPAAAEFSFLLAIPIMFAATGLSIGGGVHQLGAGDLPVFGAGFIAAFASALIVIRVLLRFVAQHDFRGFAVYRVVVGLTLIVALTHGFPLGTG